MFRLIPPQNRSLQLQLLLLALAIANSDQAILGMDFDRLPACLTFPASSTFDEATENGATVQHPMRCLGLCSADATCVAAHFPGGWDSDGGCFLMNSAQLLEVMDGAPAASGICSSQTWIMTDRYQAALSTSTTVTTTTVTTVVPWLSGASYVSCYGDNNPRDLKYKEFTSNSMTRNACLMNCKASNYKYFGLQYYSVCFCDNSYGLYGKMPESQCNYPCKGNPAEMCGGYWRNSVYAILY